MQHVKVDLPKAISMVLEQIEKVGPDFKHSTDPGRPSHLSSVSCYNVFVEEKYVDTADGQGYEYTYKPGCLIGRVIADSHEDGADKVYEGFRETGNTSSDLYESLRALKKWDVLDFDCTLAARKYLRAAQRSQDDNDTWGEAHANALSGILRDFGVSGIFEESEREFFEPRGKVLDLGEAFRLISEVIENKGEEFRHQDDPARKGANNGFGASCVNVFYKSGMTEDGYLKREAIAPGCLVGSAIHQAGWALETFDRYDVIGGPSGDLLDKVQEDGLYEDVTRAARVFFSLAQRSQDNGDTWGVAREIGLRETLKQTINPPYGYDHLKLTTPEERWLDVRPNWDVKEDENANSN